MSSVESESDTIDVTATTRWLLASALVVIVCGVLAIALPLAFSAGIAGLLGLLLLAAAGAHLIFGIYFEAVHWGWHAFIAVIYGLAGIGLMANPLLGVVLIVFLVGAVLLIEGIIEIALFWMVRQYSRAAAILIDGVVTLCLGILVCAHWPPESLEVVPYMVGASMISSGISRLILALGIRAVGRAAK